MPLKTWLCIGNKKDHSDKCMYSKISIDVIKRPLHARSNKMINVKQLFIFCCVDENNPKYIKKYVTECDKFQNLTLEVFI